jgi:succinoglycan biosynthesis protein ExoW
MNQTIAVVIPYFQREPGILLKALRSVLAQQGLEQAGARLDVIVVDDASPVPARDELGGLMAQHPGLIRIIEQSNAGPAAARNKALDHVAPGTEYVAFLDSDDEWTPPHLQHALQALNQGHDFYFADFYQLNQQVSAFARARRIDVAQHPALPGTPQLHRYGGDMQDQVLRGNIIGTPTVVYRYAIMPDLRFREEFVYAGEDYLFWLDLSSRTKGIVFSSECECVCGAGVNIFSGSGWGTEKSLIRLHYEMKYKKAIASLFTLNLEQRAANQAAVRALRQSFVADVLHRVLHRKPFGEVLRKQAAIDLRSVLYFVPLALRVLLRR